MAGRAPERRKRNAVEAKRMLAGMSLQELRQKLTNFSQEEVAERLRVIQGYISKLERQDDMLLSKLYAYVEALGGTVEIRARFPHREVRVKRAGEIKRLREALTPKPGKRIA